MWLVSNNKIRITKFIKAKLKKLDGQTIDKYRVAVYVAVKVYNLIKCIKPKPSRDIDDFSMQLLSLVAEGICAPLSSIYNLS